MTTDRIIRWATAAVVMAVAAFAAVVSYSHIYDLARTHGQAGTAARLLPLSVDGLILAAGLVLLHAARNERSAPPLARCMLSLGVAATVAANVSYGLPYGPLGAVVSAWPAVAFIGSAEMALGMVRRVRTSPAAAQPAVHPNGHGVPQGGREAAERYAAALTAGKVPSIRQLKRSEHLGTPRAREVQSYLGTLAGAGKE